MLQKMNFMIIVVQRSQQDTSGRKKTKPSYTQLDSRKQVIAF